MNGTEQLQADLIAYHDTLPDGHILKEIAQRTAYELGRDNPFDRLPNFNMTGYKGRTNKVRVYVAHLNKVNDKVRSKIQTEIEQVLRKYKV